MKAQVYRGMIICVYLLLLDGMDQTNVTLETHGPHCPQPWPMCLSSVTLQWKDTSYSTLQTIIT